MTISNTINNAEPPRNDNRNIEATKKNGTEDNNDKEKSKVNYPKQNTKRVYILGDSKINHANPFMHNAVKWPNIL